MKITFYAHASFRLEGAGLSVVTDPFTPSISGFDPINEPADIVIMSSATDDFHCDASHVTGNPVVVNALEVPEEGARVKGLAIRSFPAMESLSYDFQKYFERDPDANALYHFEIDGVRVLHMGDIGNPVAPEHLEALAGKVDLLLALTGEHATIALDDLDAAIDVIRPKAVIPMHYYSAKGVLDIEPVETFLNRIPAERVTRVGDISVDLDLAGLAHSNAPHVFVLEQSR
jgi:L-ascorbate metabolism protein UlaG (beta-lactamase superfamily)